MEDMYQPGTVVFDDWVIQRKIGSGGYGSVYEIKRDYYGEYYAALKVITIPRSEAEVDSLVAEGHTVTQAKEILYGRVMDLVQEFRIMSRLSGRTNIVSYEDHKVIPHQGSIGWDILIRMELLTPVLAYAKEHPFSRRKIIQLGIDICRALELCQKYNVIHRDIKPENIFVSDSGDFKLGDFGIAKTISADRSNISYKGTFNYMAPELFHGKEYAFNVDIYSLGLVLYRLLNRNRMPFLPQPPTPVSDRMQEQALARRIAGDPLPKPVYAEGRLWEIIRKATAHDPTQRFSSPLQMRQELKAIQYDESDSELIYPNGDILELPKEDSPGYSSVEPTEELAEDSAKGFDSDPERDYPGETRPLYGRQSGVPDDAPHIRGGNETEGEARGRRPMKGEKPSEEKQGNGSNRMKWVPGIMGVAAALCVIAVAVWLGLGNNQPPAEQTADPGAVETVTTVPSEEPAVTEKPTSTPVVESEPPASTDNPWEGTVGHVVNASSGLNVRSGPGFQYERIASLQNGNEVIALSVVGDESGLEWVEIIFKDSSGNDKHGYTGGDYIEVGNSLPSPEPDNKDRDVSTPLQVGSVARVVNASAGLNVRKGPSFDSDRIASLMTGNEVIVIEDAGDGWYKITFKNASGEDASGFVRGEYLSFG